MLDYYAVPMRFHLRFVLVFFLFSAFVFDPGLRAEEKRAPLEKLQHPRGRSLGMYQRETIGKLLDEHRDVLAPFYGRQSLDQTIAEA